MSIELTEALLAQAAGWDVMKRARAYLAQGQVVSSYWAPPLLRGVVQSEGMTFRGSLVINNSVDIDNLCNCREAREWGKICAHGVAVGLHWIVAQKGDTASAPTKSNTPNPAAKVSVKKNQRSHASRTARRWNCSSFYHPILTTPSRAAKSCSCWKQNGPVAACH